MVEWLSSIKEKDLNHCGKFVLTGDMSTLSITKIDLSNMSTLEGKLCCLKATILSLAFQECSSFLLTSSLQHTTVGDIGVFKDMPITHLNLANCYDLTGA